MVQMNDQTIKKFAEATVKAIFQSTAAAFYVDVKHDWYQCVRCSDTVKLPFKAEGIYSEALALFCQQSVPAAYQANYMLKTSCEFVRNNLNRDNAEFSIKIPVNFMGKQPWIRMSYTLIDMEDGIPHHVVLTLRNISRERWVEEKRQTILTELNKLEQEQDFQPTLQEEKQELVLQNRELSVLNRDLLESRDQLFALADNLQHYIAQNSIYREMLQMQQAGAVAIDSETLQILYMNDFAMELYEMPEDVYPTKTLRDMRSTVQLLDDTPAAVEDMPIVQGKENFCLINCSITHKDGRLFYLSVSSKRIVLEDGRGILIDIINDVTDSVLAKKELEKNYSTVNAKLLSVMDAFRDLSDSIYHVDLTTGMITENFVAPQAALPKEIAHMQVPCNYDEFIAYCRSDLGLEFLQFNGKKDIHWNCKYLIEEFYKGNTHFEIIFRNNTIGTYHRLTGLMSKDYSNQHIVLSVVGNDITLQRKQELENQRLLEEAQKRAEHTAKVLEQQQIELEEKHKYLEAAYTELMEYNSIVQGLQSVFDCCFYLDAENDAFSQIKGNWLMKKYFKVPDGLNASLAAYNAADVKPAYQKGFAEFTDISTLSSRLKDKPYLVLEYESQAFGWIKAYLLPARYNQQSQPTHYLYIAKVIDEEKTQQNHLLKLSQTDGLTGICNRITGEKRIAELLSANNPGTLGILDCDDFKGINDHCGHNAGDKVLITIASALSETLGRGNVVMRLGGDEFAFYLCGCKDKETLTASVNKFFSVLNAIQIPQLLRRKISVSVGACLYSGEAPVTFEELYTKADACLYTSKKFSGNHLSYCSTAENRIST